MTTQPLAKLHLRDTFARLVAEGVQRAISEERPYSVLALVPQHLPDEGVTEVVKTASDVVRSLTRDTDHAGSLTADVLAVGLFDTDGIEANVFASRVQSELGVRARHLCNSIWEPGIAALGRDGETAHELITAAIDAAKTRRRRIGA